MRKKRGYFFLEALVAMMIVSVVIGGTLTALVSAENVSRQKKRQMIRIMLCEDVIENIRHQWITSSDPVTKIHAYTDPDEALPEPSMGWRDTSMRCPWPTMIATEYRGQYRIQPVQEYQGRILESGSIEIFTSEDDTESPGELLPIKGGTLYQLDVKISSGVQIPEDTSLTTFLPVPGPLGDDEG